MITFRIIELNNESFEYNSRKFQSYEECRRALIKQIQSWKKLAEENLEGTIAIKKHAPHCYSLYQDDKVKLTWEIIVIPENEI